MGEFEVVCGACGAALGSSPAALDVIAPAETHWTAGARIGRYELKSELGTGAMGTVYRAFDEVLGRDVALKVLRPELLSDGSARLRFLREARILSIIRHPLVGVIFDAVEIEDVPVLVMELYDGETLATQLARASLPMTRALRIAADVCDALAAVHAAGIIHRDLKPANIMVLPDGAIRVLDFGLSKVVRPSGLTDDGVKTKRGQLIGTMAYMAPEQIQGDDAVQASDLWALGVVLFEMLVGSRPFNSARDVLSANAPLDRLELGAPAELVRALLEKSAPRRLADAREVKLALERSLLGEAASSAKQLAAGDDVDHYRLRRLIARSERAEVWLAVDSKVHRDVVLKLSSNEGLAAIRGVEWEVELVRRVRSRFVVEVLEHGLYGSRPYLVLEHIEGVTLAERLKSGPLCGEELLRVGEALADAVEAMHRAGVVHGDLTPSNILLARSGDAPLRIVDFECARDRARAAKRGMRTVMGTVPYMSPELAEGAEPNEQSDLWALGVILFESAVGHRPFEVPSTSKLLAALHLRPRPAPSRSRPELGRAFDAFWLRCSAQDLDDRPRDLAALRRELLAAIAHPQLPLQSTHPDQTAAGITTVTTRAPALQPRRWLGPTLLGAALLAGSAFVLSPVSRDSGGAIDLRRGVAVTTSETAVEPTGTVVLTSVTAAATPLSSPITSATGLALVSAIPASAPRRRPSIPPRVPSASAPPPHSSAAPPQSFEDLLERPD